MTARIAILIALLTISGTGCVTQAPMQSAAPADTTAGEVSFELAGLGGAAVVIPVRLNGQGPFNFVLDTGATFTCVDQKLAEELKLPERVGQIGLGAGVRDQGQVRLVRVDSLQVGTAKGSDLTACVIDLQQVRGLGLAVRGLLGLNFLKSFHVTLDFERKVLRLQKPESARQ